MGRIRIQFSSQSYFLSDLDALRASFGLMGSSGTKPCVKCKNIVGKVCKVDDPYFLNFTHPNLADCHQVTDDEIWEAVDTLAIKKSAMSVSDFRALEKCLGLHYVPTCLWSLPQHRRKLPLSNILFDIMHLYYANGVASSELNLCMATLDGLGVSQQMVFARLKDMNFCKNFSSHRKNTMSNIFAEKLFEGDVYKGSAQDCQSALPLLWFFVVKFVAPTNKDHWEPFVKSFGALMDIHHWFRKAKFQHALKASDLNALNDLQCKHATLFLEAYGQEKVRPKFHFRLHLPFALSKIGKFIDCEPHAPWNV